MSHIVHIYIYAIYRLELHILCIVLHIVACFFALSYIIFAYRVKIMNVFAYFWHLLVVCIICALFVHIFCKLDIFIAYFLHIFHEIHKFDIK